MADPLTYITNKDFLIEVARNNVAGASLVHKFGRNDAVPNGSWAHVNILGSAAWQLTVATTVRVKAGGNAADDVAGANARGVTIEGLDGSLVLASETVATAGVAASAATATSFFRVFRAVVSTVGTYGVANAAAITLENGAGGTDLIQMATGDGQSQFGAYTVPTGKTAYLLSVHIQVDSNKAANLRLFAREDADDVVAPMAPSRIMQFFDGVAGEFSLRPRSPLAIPGETDIWFEAFGDGGAAEASVDFELLLIDD